VVQRARAAGIADRVVAEAAALVMGEGGGPAEVLQQLGFTGRDTRQAPGEN
jgi:F420-0:gamma-glutamyl ligase